MGLSRFEQETVVNYNSAEKEAMICSADPSVKRKLAKLAEKSPMDYQMVREEGDFVTYRFPKKLISFRTSRVVTDEARQLASVRLAKYRAQKQGDDSDDETADLTFHGASTVGSGTLPSILSRTLDNDLESKSVGG